MASDKKSADYEGRSVVDLGNGEEVAYYDPTAAVEEYTESKGKTKEIGGLKVDEGRKLERTVDGRIKGSKPGRTIAVAKVGEEEPFSFLRFPAVAPRSAGDVDSAMRMARGALRDMGLKSDAFLSFDITTHYYMAALGKRECGWSFTFHIKPFAPVPGFSKC